MLALYFVPFLNNIMRKLASVAPFVADSPQYKHYNEKTRLGSPVCSRLSPGTSESCYSLQVLYTDFYNGEIGFPTPKRFNSLLPQHLFYAFERILNNN